MQKIKDVVYGKTGIAKRDEIERDFESFKIGLQLKKASEEKKCTQKELVNLVYKKTKVYFKMRK